MKNSLKNTIKFFLLTVVMQMFTTTTNACLWISGTTLDGSYSSRIHPSLYVRNIVSAHNASAQDRINDQLNYSDHDFLDAKELKLIAQGQYKQAIAQYLQLDKETQSKHYHIASNLGTAYELNGDPENARKWILEGINRDPKSHHGTEWLHLYILDYKLGKIKTSFSDQIKKYTQKEIPQDKPFFEYQDQLYDYEEVHEALRYQLTERLHFVKKDSPIVADLLHSLVLLEAPKTSLESMVEVLEIAEKYASDQQLNEISTLKNQYQQKIDNVSIVESAMVSLEGRIALAIVGVPLLYFVIKRMVRNHKKLNA